MTMHVVDCPKSTWDVLVDDATPEVVRIVRGPETLSRSTSYVLCYHGWLISKDRRTQSREAGWREVRHFDDVREPQIFCELLRGGQAALTDITEWTVPTGLIQSWVGERVPTVADLQRRRQRSLYATRR